MFKNQQNRSFGQLSPEEQIKLYLKKIYQGNMVLAPRKISPNGTLCYLENDKKYSFFSPYSLVLIDGNYYIKDFIKKDEKPFGKFSTVTPARQYFTLENGEIVKKGVQHGVQALALKSFKNPDKTTPKDFQAMANCSQDKINFFYGTSWKPLKFKTEKGGKDKFYVVCPFFEGKELFFYIKNCHIKDVAEAIKLISSIVDEVDKIHKENKAHLDIKFENIMYNQEKRTVALVDFDFSLDIDSFLKTSLGTEGYTAPEIKRLDQGEAALQVKASMDIYSLGVVFMTILLVKCQPRIYDEDEELNQDDKKYQNALSELQAQLVEGINLDCLIHTTLQMLNEDPESRPNIKEIKTNLAPYLKLKEREQKSDCEGKTPMAFRS
jgi:serine/threonine protein kinase